MRHSSETKKIESAVIVLQGDGGAFEHVKVGLFIVQHDLIVLNALGLCLSRLFRHIGDIFV